MPIVYAFWNNKGGTGKTSLAFQSIALYAEKHPEQRILAIDLCPQANLSELMLGGLNRFAVLPRLRRTASTMDVHTFNTLLYFEAIAMVGVFAAAAALAHSVPGAVALG